MSDKEQSAVDFLVENYLPLKRGLELKEPNVIKTINQAKELFKQQIIDAHCDGQSIEDTSGVSDAKQYFNDKFKTESNGK